MADYLSSLMNGSAGDSVQVHKTSVDGKDVVAGAFDAGSGRPDIMMVRTAKGKLHHMSFVGWLAADPKSRLPKDAVSVVLPYGTTYVGPDMFAGADKLTMVKLPSSVKEIANGAFRDCPSLRDVQYNKAACPIVSLSEFGADPKDAPACDVIRHDYARRVLRANASKPEVIGRVLGRREIGFDRMDPSTWKGQQTFEAMAGACETVNDFDTLWKAVRVARGEIQRPELAEAVNDKYKARQDALDAKLDTPQPAWLRQAGYKRVWDDMEQRLSTMDKLTRQAGNEAFCKLVGIKPTRSELEALDEYVDMRGKCRLTLGFGDEPSSIVLDPEVLDMSELRPKSEFEMTSAVKEGVKAAYDACDSVQFTAKDSSQRLLSSDIVKMRALYDMGWPIDGLKDPEKAANDMEKNHPELMAAFADIRPTGSRLENIRNMKARMGAMGFETDYVFDYLGMEEPTDVSGRAMSDMDKAAVGRYRERHFGMALDAVDSRLDSRVINGRSVQCQKGRSVPFREDGTLSRESVGKTDWDKIAGQHGRFLLDGTGGRLEEANAYRMVGLFDEKADRTRASRQSAMTQQVLHDMGFPDACCESFQANAGKLPKGFREAVLSASDRPLGPGRGAYIAELMDSQAKLAGKSPIAVLKVYDKELYGDKACVTETAWCGAKLGELMASYKRDGRKWVMSPEPGADMREVHAGLNYYNMMTGRATTEFDDWIKGKPFEAEFRAQEAEAAGKPGRESIPDDLIPKGGDGGPKGLGE